MVVVSSGWEAMKPVLKLAGADQSPCGFVDVMHGAGIVMVGGASLLLLDLCWQVSPMTMETIRSKALVDTNFPNLTRCLFRLSSMLTPLCTSMVVRTLLWTVSVRRLETAVDAWLVVSCASASI